MKVTQWFPPKEKPVRSGVYQTRTPGNGKILYCYWTGSYWCLRMASKDSLVRWQRKSLSQKVTWRGIPESETRAMLCLATSQMSASRQGQASQVKPASSRQARVAHK